MMLTFLVKFQHCEPLCCDINDTDLGRKYFDLVKNQYLSGPFPLFRDPQCYTLNTFSALAQQAKNQLGWNWLRSEYTVDITTQLHKDLEQYLAQGYENIPAEQDDLLHELHFALHAIESGSRRDNWLQIEWYNNNGFSIGADDFPAKILLEFGDIRLQNPYVGHHPLYLYQQRDSTNVLQTCCFHDFVKPGINIVTKKNSLPFQWQFNTQKYLAWFMTHGKDFLTLHGQEKLLKFTGHPIVGRVTNLDVLETVVSQPEIRLEWLEF